MMATLTRQAVFDALAEVRDPCLGGAGLPISILDLGLIGDVRVDADSVSIDITFTEPGCMFTHRIIAEIKDRLMADGASQVDVLPIWAPAWRSSRMTPRAVAAFAEIRRDYPELLAPSHVAARPTKIDERRVDG